MYRLHDLHRCQNDIKLNPKQPSAVLDTPDFAISAITSDGNLIYCNRAFLKAYKIEPKHGFKTSIRESLPELWERFKNPHAYDDNTLKVINLRSGDYKDPLGHLLVSSTKNSQTNRALDLYSLVSLDNNPDFINSYVGLYVANPEANTVKVNPSYEKIAFLSQNDVVGRNLEELVEKGFFSKSVTLSVLNELKLQNSAQQSFFQSLLCGKDVLVTGTPVFSDQNELAYVLTYVQDLLVLETIAGKCIDFETQTKTSRTVFVKGMQHQADDRSKKRSDTELPKFDELPVIASDPLMISTLKQVVRASAYEAPILLTGETGVGKDLLAKYIHLLYLQEKNVPFIEVNSSAIPGDLLESELFGYEAGAFSGASKKGRTGLFAAADGGILFLNEISEIPLALQAKLLSALDDGYIRPLGSSKTRKVKVRIICASNRDLKTCIRDGSFRSDLYYRIKALTIKVSPLRRRRRDILPLVHHFMSRLSARYGLTRYLSPAVQDILLGYDWPGNVRELRNVVEQLMIYTSTAQVSMSDLPEELLGEPDTAMERQTHLPDGTMPLKTAVREFERKIIRDALALNETTADAAKYLGIDPTTLTRKLKKRP